MFNLFPFTNFHDLNMDWIIKNIKTLWSKAVFTVNNTMPDDNGNVNLPGVSGVTSVNGIGADGQGNIELTVVNSRVHSTTGLTLETGVSNANYVITRRPQLGIITLSLNFTLSESKLTHAAIIKDLPSPTTGGPVWFLVRDINTGLCYRLNIDYNGTITSENNLSEGTYEGNVTYSYLGDINMDITQG